MGFWEDLKDAFKTKSQRDEERAEEMRKALEAEKEVTKKLEELEKQYQDYLNSQKVEVNLDELFPPTQREHSAGNKNITYYV